MFTVRNPNDTSVSIHGRVFPAKTVVNLSETFLRNPKRLEALHRLLQSGKLVSDDVVAPAPAEDSSEDLTDRAARLKEIVDGFDPTDEDHWMTDGRPQVSAINDALEEGEAHYSAAERDEIWRLVRG